MNDTPQTEPTQRHTLQNKKRQLLIEIRHYLTHPLALIGLVVLVFLPLFYGVHAFLFWSGIIPPLTKDVGSVMVHTILSDGFMGGLVLIAVGSALRFLKKGSKK